MIRSLLVKKDLNILLTIRDAKKIDLHVYSSQKWVHIERILMKLYIYMSYLIKDDELLEKCYEIWEKTKKSHKILKDDSQYICLSVILIDSALRTGKSYYPQLFLEECKYVVIEKKIHKYIIGDIEISSDSDRDNSDEDLWQIPMKKNKKY